jgi:hypothetical protein
MNKPWNFELPNDPSLRGMAIGVLYGTPSGLAACGACVAAVGIYELLNLPKEGDPKETIEEEETDSQ